MPHIRAVVWHSFYVQEIFLYNQGYRSSRIYGTVTDFTTQSRITIGPIFSLNYIVYLQAGNIEVGNSEVLFN